MTQAYRIVELIVKFKWPIIYNFVSTSMTSNLVLPQGRKKIVPRWSKTGVNTELVSDSIS